MLVAGSVRPDTILLDPQLRDSPHALDCERVEIAEWLRIYFKADESDGNGFSAAIIEIVASGTDRPWDENLEDTEARVVGYCTAYFDGIRHLRLGQDGKGYLFHPEMQDWIRAIQALHDLEKKYCRDWE